MVPYLHNFSVAVQKMHFFGDIWDKFAFSQAKIYYHNLKKDAGTAPSKGLIWEEFSEQLRQKASKKASQLALQQI